MDWNIKKQMNDYKLKDSVQLTDLFAGKRQGNLVEIL